LAQLNLGSKKQIIQRNGKADAFALLRQKDIASIYQLLTIQSLQK
jgi:hypothetical protein